MAKYTLTFMDITACEIKNFKDVQDCYREIPGIKSYDDAFKIINRLVTKFDLRSHAGYVSITEYPRIRITLYYKSNDNHSLQFMVEKTE